jgi:hypothetical protein
MLGGEEKLPAEWTEAPLRLKQPSAEVVQGTVRFAACLAQYSARAGSSGDDPAWTIWCRTIPVQECLTR